MLCTSYLGGGGRQARKGATAYETTEGCHTQAKHERQWGKFLLVSLLPLASEFVRAHWPTMEARCVSDGLSFCPQS